MPNYKYTHVHLISPDPEKTADFYARTFGAVKSPPHTTPSGAISIHLDLHGALIQVSGPRTQPPEYGLNHFGLITDDLAAAIKELKSNGIKFQLEPPPDRPDLKTSFFWGPDNTLIELIEDKSKF
jgi:catechol 2,3-dioxygenase-like lactoylglutathione lyase family enzyme